MKKHQLFIILLVVMVLLVLADYRVTQPEGLNLPEKASTQSLEVTEELNDNLGSEEVPEVKIVSHFNITQSVLDQSQDLSSYSIEKRTRVLDLFESFDLTNIPNLVAYRNALISNSENTNLPIYVYEIQSAPGQGKVNYLSIRQTLEKQLLDSDTLNETGQFGANSLYYNNSSNEAISFLLVQIKDTVFGFQFAKSPANSFEYIQAFIKNYQTLIINS